MNINKKFSIALILLVVLASSLAQSRHAYAAESTTQEKALSAITNIIGFDMTKYTAQLTRYFQVDPSIRPSNSLGNSTEEHVEYTLEFAGKKTKVMVIFINKALTHVELATNDGSPLPSLSAQQLPHNIIEATKNILQRLQIYTEGSYIQEMRNMLDHTITEVKNMETTVGNLKCKIEVVDEYYTAITWVYTSKGVEYPKKVGVYFENGSLLGFSDSWNLYAIGSESVNISREEAIRIAREQAEKNATTVTFFGGEVVTFNLTGRVDASIRGVPREPLTAYPFWHIQLYTDIYGGVNQIQVGIWADTGKIEYCNPTGFYGDAGENSPTSTTPPPTQTSEEAATENGSSPFEIYVVAGLAVGAIAVATTAVVIKKKCK